MVGFTRRLPFLVLLSLASIRLLRPVSSKPQEATRHSLCKNCAADPATLCSETRQAAREESVRGALRLRCLSLRGGKRESSRKHQAGLSAKSIRESGVKKQSRTGGTVRGSEKKEKEEKKEEEEEKKKKKKKKVKEKDPSSNHERDRRTGSMKEKKEKRKEQKEKKEKQGERKTEQKVPKDRDTPNTHGMRGKSKDRSKRRQEDTPEKVIREAGKPAKNDGDAAPADKFRDRDTPKRRERRTPQDGAEGDKEHNPADDVSKNGTSTAAVPPASRSSLDQEEEVVYLTEGEKEMMRFANSLSPEQQQAIDGLMRGWVRLNASTAEEEADSDAVGMELEEEWAGDAQVGVRVVKVFEGVSAAATAGVAVGDRLLSVDGADCSRAGLPEIGRRLCDTNAVREVCEIKMAKPPAKEGQPGREYLVQLERPWVNDPEVIAARNRAVEAEAIEYLQSWQP